jgi:hypothetical protein
MSNKNETGSESCFVCGEKSNKPMCDTCIADDFVREMVLVNSVAMLIEHVRSIEQRLDALEEKV